MDGLMMDFQLTVPPLLRRAETYFPGKQIVTRLPDKSFAVAWEDDISYNDQVYVRRLARDGRSMGTMMRINTIGTTFIPDRVAPRIAVLGNGLAATFGDRHRSLGFDVGLKVVGPRWDDAPPPPRDDKFTVRPRNNARHPTKALVEPFAERRVQVEDRDPAGGFHSRGPCGKHSKPWHCHRRPFTERREKIPVEHVIGGVYLCRLCDPAFKTPFEDVRAFHGFGLLPSINSREGKNSTQS